MNLDKETTAMKVRPLHDRVLIKRIEEKEAAKAGIIIPDTAKECARRKFSRCCKSRSRAHPDNVNEFHNPG